MSLDFLCESELKGLNSSVTKLISNKDNQKSETTKEKTAKEKTAKEKTTKERKKNVQENQESTIVTTMEPPSKNQYIKNNKHESSSEVNNYQHHHHHHHHSNNSKEISPSHKLKEGLTAHDHNKKTFIELFLDDYDSSIELKNSKVTVDFDKLMNIFPIEYQKSIESFFHYKNEPEEKNPIVEFVLDVGRVPYLFYYGNHSCKEESDDKKEEEEKEEEERKKNKEEEENKERTGRRQRSSSLHKHYLLSHHQLVTYELLNSLTEKTTDFSEIDNRAGIPETLHRISRKLNKQKKVVGLTIRVGRSISNLYNLIANELSSNQNILLLGAPGSGKTSLLRSCAKYLADDMNKRVELVDTSSEVGGAGDIIYKDLINCRRTFVPDKNTQHQVILEAICNHSPEYVLVDEIGNQNEVRSLLDVSQRGIHIFTTAHGNTLYDIYQNPVLNKLLGDFQNVILSSSEVKERNEQSKTVKEKKGKSCFHSIVEVRKPGVVVVINNVDKAIDSLLNKSEYPVEIRCIKNGQLESFPMSTVFSPL